MAPLRQNEIQMKSKAMIVVGTTKIHHMTGHRWFHPQLVNGAVHQKVNHEKIINEEWIELKITVSHKDVSIAGIWASKAIS